MGVSVGADAARGRCDRRVVTFTGASVDCDVSICNGDDVSAWVVGATVVGERVVGAADVGATVVSFMSFLSKSVAFGGVVGAVARTSDGLCVAPSGNGVERGVAVTSFT